jgi:hypothetical protein
MWQKCGKNVAKMWQKCGKNVAKMWQKCCEIIIFLFYNFILIL